MDRFERLVCRIWDRMFSCYSCGKKHTRLGYHEDEK